MTRPGPKFEEIFYGGGEGAEPLLLRKLVYTLPDMFKLEVLQIWCILRIPLPQAINGDLEEEILNKFDS